jgi:serine/threonine protein kinase
MRPLNLGGVVERTVFFDRLRQKGLLSEAEIEQAASRFGDTDPTQVIADALVQDGKLTPYQVHHVYAGDTQPLTLGQYRILDELGHGGMGHVYKALHAIMGRVVAIKVISPELVQNPVAVEWFRREVRASTQLVHPNIAMAYDANEAEGLHFLVMEYVEGGTLDALVKKEGPLPVDHACALMRQAALGLQHAHEKGMVHRDIKPANLLIPQSEQPSDVLVKIVDFGLARLQSKATGDTIALRTQTGMLGTPDYVSPEQSRDIHAADIRSDLYSLGCTFYFALAGHPPFPGETVMEKLIKHLMEEPTRLEEVRPEVSSSVAAIVRRLMAKRPDERQQTPQDLVRDLDAVAEQLSKASLTGQTPCRVPRLPLANPAPDVPTPTKMLDRVEVFAPPREPEPSGPSLFEPQWKHAPGEVRQVQTHDTVEVSEPQDTEMTTAVATALKDPQAAMDSDSTLQEVHGSAAVLSNSITPAPAAPPGLDRILRNRWRQWTHLIELIVEGYGNSRVDAESYRAVHTALLHACRVAVESSTTPERRAFHQEIVSIVQPWLNLSTFVHVERPMLESLLDRCKRIELELHDGKLPWTMRQFLGLALLLLSPLGLVVWYWQYGRQWLPALVQSFRGGALGPSLQSASAYVSNHPALLLGAVFPIAILVARTLMTRTRI